MVILIAFITFLVSFNPLQLRDDDDVDDEEEDIEGETRTEEVEAMLRFEFPPEEEEEDDGESEETEEAAVERLEMEIGERFDTDDNSLSSVTVLKHTSTSPHHRY